MEMGPLYIFITLDLGNNGLKQHNKKPNGKEGSKDLVLSKKNQHYINKLKSFKHFIEKN